MDQGGADPTSVDSHEGRSRRHTQLVSSSVGWKLEKEDEKGKPIPARFAPALSLSQIRVLSR